MSSDKDKSQELGEKLAEKYVKEVGRRMDSKIMDALLQEDKKNEQ